MWVANLSSPIDKDRITICCLCLCWFLPGPVIYSFVYQRHPHVILMSLFITTNYIIGIPYLPEGLDLTFFVLFCPFLVRIWTEYFLRVDSDSSSGKPTHTLLLCPFAIRTTLPPTTQMSQSIPFGHSEWKYLFTLSLPKIPFRGQERTRMTRPGNTICQSIQPFRLPLLPRSHPLNKYGEIEIPQLTSGLFNSLLDGGEEVLEQQSERGRCFAVVAGG